MTQDPKKLPSWLSGDNQPPNEPPPSEPPPSDAPEGDDDANVPPWLRGEQPPEPPQPSKLKRVAPPPDRDGTGSLPPWLAGADEEAKPKSYKIGGTELSEDYFAAADNLADTADTGMTFDAWIADQEESRREKDIEEEIPDDLLDVIANEPPPPKGTGMLKSTGQLPDWFLGLESLDTTEAPEWFQNEDEEAPQAAAAPLWMSDMMNDEPDEPADELPPADEIGSFFSSLGGMPDDEEETPEIDWYDQGTLPDDAGQTLNDDFFANLVGGTPAAPEPTANDFYAETPNYPPQPSYDTFEDFDDFDRGEVPNYWADEQPARGAVEIPQNELDAFLSDFDAQQAVEPVSLDDIEDPDLDWLESAAPTASEPEPYTPPAEAGEESVNWLSELQGIVAGATRILPTPEEDVSKLGTQEIRISTENTPAAASAAAEDFSWPELSNEAVPEAAVPETPAPEESWLNDIYLSDELLADAEPPQEAPASVPRSRLTDRLYRDVEPPAQEPASEWESLTSAINDDSLFADETENAPEASGYSLFSEEASSGEPDNFDLFADEDSAEAGGYSLFDETPASATESSSYSLFEDDEPTAASFAPSTGGDDEDNVLASDLQTGWLRQDLFSDDEPTTPESAPPPATADDDFFSKLANDSDSNVLFDEPDAEQSGWSSDVLFADASDSNSLYDAQPANAAWQPDEQQPAANTDDDFFAALDFGDEPEAAQAQAATNDDDIFAAMGLDENAGDDDFLAGLNAEAAAPEGYEPWQGSIAEQAQATSDEADDDFFAAMGFEDVTPAAEPELYDPWNQSNSVQEQPASAETYDVWSQNEAAPETPAAADDDIFAALGMNDLELADDVVETGWSGQNSDADAEEADGATEEDFFARLNMSDEAPAAEPELYDPWQQPTSEAPAGETDNASLYAMPGTDELSASWLEQDAEPAAQETANATDDDFFASLNFGEDDAEAEATPANDLPFEAWAQGETPAAQDDDFFASLGADAGATTPENALPNQYEQWQDEGASDDFFAATDAATESASAEDDFFASLGMDSGADDENLPDFLQEANAEPASTDEVSFEEVPDDFFSVLDIGGGSDDAADLPNDDLFAQWQAEPDPNDTGITPDDFFASLGMDNTDGTVQSAGSDDPFGNWDTGTNANIPPSQDFFAALDTMGDEQPSEWNEAPPQPDFFATLAEPEQEPKAPPAFTDVDDYLASLGDDATAGMLRESMGQNQEIDLDKLFAEPVAETPKAPSQAQLDLLPGADEDWLAQLHTSVGEVSASAIVRQKEDRPVEELPERLQRLRALSGEMPEPATEDLDALAPAPDNVVSGAPTLGQDTALTQEQQKRVDLLRALVPSERKRQEATRLSAIEATYDSPFMADLEDTPEVVLQPAASETVAKPKRARRRRRRLNIRFDRFLVALLLGAAVVLPFIVPGFRIGSLPPASFVAGSNGQMAFDQIEALESGDLVLVGVEYGSASAAELDSMTEALLRHIIMKAAYPVLISSNPVGLLRSESRLNTINQDIDFLRQIGATQPLIPNNDYYIVRYLPGSVIGLRAFSGDTANLLLSDIHGQATNLVVRSMSDFALVAVVTDRAEDLRGYAEQIAPLTGAPLLSAVSYGAAPLVEPYASALDGGLLVGYADAYTYTDLLGTVEARSIANRVRIIPTPEPTQPAPQQEENAAEATQPAVRATGIRATPTIAATPTPALDTATVIATGSVNMRIGPSTENPVLAAVPSGTTLPVIGYNPDRSWVNVALPDGRTGWISASLLSISEAQSAAPKQELYGKRQQVEEGEEQTPTPRPPTATRVFPTLARTATTEVEATDAEATTAATEEADATSTPRPTRTALPTATRTPVPTAEPTEEATPEATVEVTEEIASAALPPPPPSPGYRDERWYAMNLGVIASALIITLGMVINLLRGLLRRGRRA